MALPKRAASVAAWEANIFSNLRCEPSLPAHVAKKVAIIPTGATVMEISSSSRAPKTFAHIDPWAIHEGNLDSEWQKEPKPNRTSMAHHI